MRSIIHFLKYNNLTVIILALILLVGAGAFAATDAGQAAIGQQTTSVQGVDNTLLLTANPDAMNLDFKIEKIEQDVNYYYVTYTFLNLVKVDNAWQYQLTEKSRKVTKKIKRDLGAYLAEEFKQEHDAIVKDLKEEQAKASLSGEETRQEVTEYTGLIGQTLDAVAAVFPNYEPVKKIEMESPVVPAEVLAAINSATSTVPVSADNLTAVYNNYIAKNDPDHDDVFGAADNCPLIYNPDQKDTDADGLGDVCDIDQMGADTASSTSETGSSTEPAPVVTPDIIIPVEPPPDASATEPLGAPVVTQ